MNGVDLNQIGEVSSGFILVIITMACVGAGLLFFFIKKQWLLVQDNEMNNGLHREVEKSQKQSNGKSHVEYHIFKREKTTS